MKQNPDGVVEVLDLRGECVIGELPHIRRKHTVRRLEPIERSAPLACAGGRDGRPVTLRRWIANRLAVNALACDLCPCRYVLYVLPDTVRTRNRPRGRLLASDRLQHLFERRT